MPKGTFKPNGITREKADELRMTWQKMREQQMANADADWKNNPAAKEECSEEESKKLWAQLQPVYQKWDASATEAFDQESDTAAKIIAYREALLQLEALTDDWVRTLGCKPRYDAGLH